MIRKTLLALVVLAVLVLGSLYTSGRSTPAATFAIAYKSSLGFGGLWRVELEPAGNGTRGLFVEEVTIPNPFLRAIGRLAGSPGQHLDLYLKDLRRITKSKDEARLIAAGRGSF